MTPASTSTRRAVVLSMLAAVLLLVLFVLPAEYGVDPTGVGTAVGLVGLADPPPRALYGQDEPLLSDRSEFILLPYESLELKYGMHSGDAMLFDWQADGELLYDFHSEPTGAAEGFAESFDDGRTAQNKGAYVAPFAGEHGWFWENRTANPVALSVQTTGFFTSVVLYRDGRTIVRPINGLSQSGSD